MKESQIYWKQLINIWCIEEGHYGFTIPYIIGSVRMNTSMKEYNIDDFFLEVIDSKEELKISYCPDLEELIIGPFKHEDGPKKYFENIDLIYFTKSNFETKITNYKELIEFFNNKYSTKIDKGFYSKDYNTKEWTTTTDD